jgi:hypothetical protein
VDRGRGSGLGVGVVDWGFKSGPLLQPDLNQGDSSQSATSDRLLHGDAFLVQPRQVGLCRFVRAFHATMNALRTDWAFIAPDSVSATDHLRCCVIT